MIYKLIEAYVPQLAKEVAVSHKKVKYEQFLSQALASPCNGELKGPKESEMVDEEIGRGAREKTPEK